MPPVPLSEGEVRHLSDSGLNRDGLQHAKALGPDGRLRARFSRKLLKDAFQMSLDRFGRHAQLSGDLLVRSAPGNELDNRALAHRQFVACWRSGRLAPFARHFPQLLQ